MAKSSDPSDFSPTTKRELADRAGHHCSRCLALTTCSDEQGKPFRIGDAAHQAAASEQGPRYDPDQTDTERSSVENGLWLCSSCHRKIDGDKYRYSVQDLKQMKAEAEERARKMVHGEIVFEMKNKEAAAIEHYLSSRPLTNFLPKSSPIADDPLLANGAKLGIQIIPYRAVFEVPRLNYPELIKNGVPRSELVIHPSPTPDNKGVFVVDGREVSRIDKDATAQLWRNYSGGSEPRLPYVAFANHILQYVSGARIVFARHGIHDERIIVRTQLENVLGKLLVYDDSGLFSPPIQSPILKIDYVISDRREDQKILRQLWYGAGAYELGHKVIEVVRTVEARAGQWKQSMEAMNLLHP